MTIDAFLNQLGEMWKKLSAVGSKVGDQDPLEALVQAGSGETLKAVQKEARLLPPPIGGMVAQVGGSSEALAVGQARGELEGGARRGGSAGSNSAHTDEIRL